MRALRILHAEDDPDDALLIHLSLQQFVEGCDIRHVEDGQAAIDYLRDLVDSGNGSGEPVPDLVILDLKLPIFNGFEVLTWIRATDRFRTLPVVILSGSCLTEDRAKAHVLGANEFFTKSPGYREILQFVSQCRRELDSTASPQAALGKSIPV